MKYLAVIRDLILIVLGLITLVGLFLFAFNWIYIG